jgi:hypothetical protein
MRGKLAAGMATLRPCNAPHHQLSIDTGVHSSRLPAE